MSSLHDPLNVLRQLDGFHYFSLKALEEQKLVQLNKLPVSVRIVLESLLCNYDGKKIQKEDILSLAKWDPKQNQKNEVPFVVSRVILQDFTGIPLAVDLAAMRDAAQAQNKSPNIIEPLVPVDLVIDHSVQVDKAGSEDSYQFNLNLECERNQERYSFLKWAQQAFKTFKVVPPGVGIVHQVNLENIATLVAKRKIADKTVLLADTLVGTDSHTTMINGLGVLGWGVGGIEAEAAMLGQPVFIQTPEVVGVELTGKLAEGVTATDLALRITEILRKENVVGKFVEFYGKGAASLSVADRATISNMAPEYGATVGFFPADDKTLEYLKITGRDPGHVELIKKYLQAQGIFGISQDNSIQFNKVVKLDLSTLKPSVAGPKRPQDRIDLSSVKTRFLELLQTPVDKGGYGKSKEEIYQKVNIHSDGQFSLAQAHESGGTLEEEHNFQIWSEEEMVTNRPFNEPDTNPGYTEGKHVDATLQHGSVVIAAITSCTNTSNPSVMIGAGLLAKKAVEKGLKVNPMIKTSLAPGSRVVTDYLENAGLMPYLKELGFHLVAYGCTTCIGNSGPLDETLEEAIKKFDLVTASVLSGNRNFEARVHGSVKANFLMSPPLVVAFAIAGRVDIDLDHEPLGINSLGEKVFLKDIWPSSEEIEKAIHKSVQPKMFAERYKDAHKGSALWEKISSKAGHTYKWEDSSTYIQNPPYFKDFSLNLPPKANLQDMRILAILGDSVTTDHISPAGAILDTSPAGKYLLSKHVTKSGFNSYGSRRGNHEVMMRGTFANVRIRNKLVPNKEGGFTKLFPEGKEVSIFEAAEAYEKQHVPLVVFAGKDYGMGSSRDWAAKGTLLLGVRAVVASSYERIHRSNLLGMGVLPLQFQEGESVDTLNLSGDELVTIKGIKDKLQPQQEVELWINGQRKTNLRVRIDTPTEVEYYEHGGILPYVLRHLIQTV